MNCKYKLYVGEKGMFEIECLTKSEIACEKESCDILCNPIDLCGPDYGTDCRPQCDPADD